MTPALDRRGLREALSASYPWVIDTEVGPRAVEAGECERCARRPRCVPTCGPVAWTSLCADCARDLGDDSWCEGHRAEGRDHLAWVARLPPEWPTVVRLWWVASGEVTVDAAWLAVARTEVSPQVTAALLGSPG